MGFQLNLFFLLAVLLACGASLDWQAAGTMNSTVISTIWSQINTNFVIGTLSQSQLAPKVKDLSDFLNKKWDPAWNVVLIYNYAQGNVDSVIYGYAFNDHWMWYNGIKGADGHYVGFVIWKDYNCKEWVTINENSNTYNFANADSAFKSALTNFPPNYDDIWGTANKWVEYFQTSNPNLKGDAYSIIISQSANPYFFARICVVGYFIRNYAPFGN